MRATAVRCRIRLMRPGDIPQVLDIERESFPTAWPQTVYRRELKNKMARYLVAYEPSEDGGAPDTPADASSETSALRRLAHRLLVRPPEPPTRDNILGMVGLWFVIGEAHIVTIAVGKEHRRQGIGEVLLVAALEAAKGAAQDVVTLEYRISNEAARRLYDKYGFAEAGVRERYYTDNNEDAVLMTTPPLRSSQYRRLLERRVGELQNRWGEDNPLADRAAWLARATRSGRS